MGNDPSTWSADRREAERENRRIQERRQVKIREKEERKAAKRARDQKKAAVRAERKAKFDRKVKVAGKVIAGKREGKGRFADIKTVDDNPTETVTGADGKETTREKHIDLPEAVGSGKPRKLSKAEKKLAKQRAREAKIAQKRGRIIDKHLQTVPRDLADTSPETVTDLAPDPQPYLTEKERAELSPDARAIIEKREQGAPREGHVDLPPAVGSDTAAPAEPSDADRLERAAANRDQIVASKTGPGPNDPVLKAAEGLGDIGELREAIDGRPTGLDWDPSIPQEVRDDREAEYIRTGVAKPGQRILDEPLDIPVETIHRNAIKRNRLYNKIFNKLKESVPPKVEDEEEYDALLVSHGDAVVAFDGLYSRFVSANVSKRQSGVVSRRLLAQDMEKIITAGVPDTFQRAEVLGALAELKAIE